MLARAACLLLLCCTLAPATPAMSSQMPGAAKEIDSAANRVDVVEAARFAVEQQGQKEVRSRSPVAVSTGASEAPACVYRSCGRRVAAPWASETSQAPFECSQ